MIEQGADRITLARELAIEEVAAIYEKTGADLEIFVHGALCVAYSGQCFSSEAWGGRSANRGQCAQACRLPYEMLVDGTLAPLGDARYLLSPGDLSALHHMPQIIEAGVGCLKIEGRYKDADYVALTTRSYRRAVDDAWAGRPLAITAREELELEQVYSRGLGPYFISGVNHQAVVRGRSPRHRGVQIGMVAEVREQSVRVEPAPAHQIAPLKAGDGVVFDAADWRSPEEDEEGGRVYLVAPLLDGRLELSFANNAVNFRSIRSGDLVWRTHDPDLDRVVRPYLDPAAPVAKQPVTVYAIARADTSRCARNGRSRAGIVRGRGIAGASGRCAESRPHAKSRSKEQFGRLGNTPYSSRGSMPKSQARFSYLCRSSIACGAKRSTSCKRSNRAPRPERFIPRRTCIGNHANSRSPPHGSTFWSAPVSSSKRPSRPGRIASLSTTWTSSGCARQWNV